MNNTKPTLLIVGAFPPPGRKIFGGVVTACQALRESSFGSRFNLLLVDSTQISNPPPGILLRAVLALRRFALFARVLFVAKPQAVLLFASSGGSVLEKGLMARVTRLRRTPVFIFPQSGKLMERGSISRAHRFLIDSSLKSATHFLCQGPVWQRFATEALGFKADRAPVVLNWTATGRLLSIGEERKPRGAGHVPSLLFLGWLERAKGIFELLNACAGLHSSHAFRLVIAGRGHAEAEARSFVEDSGLANVTEFVGWVQGSELESLLLSSDVLVLPSWAEGLPNAMIEAMAAQLAVVVSAVGNVPGLITDEREALLVPAREVRSLQNAIERLLVDQVFREQLAYRGHVFARDNFGIEPAVEKLSSVIERAIHEFSPRLAS